MFKEKDPYTYTRFCKLFSKSGTLIGEAIIEYQVTSYDDIQIADFSSVGKAQNRKFIVVSSQRITIYNPESDILAPTPNLDVYENYPAMINCSMSPVESSGMNYRLLDYSPKTINTQVQSSSSTGDTNGETNETSTTRTEGSSVSQTNSYSASVGVSGDLSASYQYSQTVSREQSIAQQKGSAINVGSSSSQEASMSIKDWGGYALVDPEDASPIFIFGQEYPWNAITCRKSTEIAYPNNTDLVQIVVPKTMLSRLYNGGTLYPPSELSMFGIDFIMKASWVVAIDNNASDEININHTPYYYLGAHTVNSDQEVSVYISQYPIPVDIKLDGADASSTTLNLPLLALAPVGVEYKSAIIGFIPRNFIIKPIPANDTKSPTSFKILSSTNDLLIKDTSDYVNCGEGAGFTATETALHANFTVECTKLQMTAYFKIIDSSDDYRLYLKHWKSDSVGVLLTLVINEDKENPISVYVDAAEAEGGEHNLTSIILRNQNFTSVEYDDRLQLGLNSIEISIQPIGGESNAQNSGYELRAISIEKE